MNSYDLLGEIVSPVQKVKSQFMINIIEGRQYYKNNVNTYVKIKIPFYFQGKTKTIKATNSPSYFKVFNLPIYNVHEYFN